jgi:hypothetical protein
MRSRKHDKTCFRGYAMRDNRGERRRSAPLQSSLGADQCIRGSLIRGRDGLLPPAVRRAVGHDRFPPDPMRIVGRAHPRQLDAAP